MTKKLRSEIEAAKIGGFLLKVCNVTLWDKELRCEISKTF